MISLGYLYTYDTNDDNDNDDVDNDNDNDDNNTRRTSHDCIGSLTSMPNEPKTWLTPTSYCKIWAKSNTDVFKYLSAFSSRDFGFCVPCPGLIHFFYTCR